MFTRLKTEKKRQLVEKELALCRLIGHQIHLNDDDSLRQATADHRSIAESLKAPSNQEPGKPKLLPSAGQI